MQFTGKNLALVRKGLNYALAEVHNMIATCPDVERYADEIEEYAEEQRQLERLLAKVNKAIAKERS